MIDVWQKCINFAYKIQIFPGTANPFLSPKTITTRPSAGFCSHESSWPDWLFFGGYGPVMYIRMYVLS